jgi:HTH-type transcriptional regulator / antitoxin MqsA
MVTSFSEARDYPSYDLRQIHSLAALQKVVYASRSVQRDAVNLGYELDDVCRCLQKLKSSDFRHSGRYEAPLGYDVYRIRFISPTGYVGQGLPGHRSIFVSSDTRLMSFEIPMCPVCGQAALKAVTFSDTFKHNERDLVVDALEGYECAKCNSEPIFPAQIRRNQVRIKDARRLADGLMSGNEIRQAREGLGLSQQEAATLFGGGTNGFSKYERGEVAQSVAMDRLLRLVKADPSKLDELRAMAGIPAHSRRASS